MKISTQLSIQLMQNFFEKVSWSYHEAFVMNGMYKIATRDDNEKILDWIESKFDQFVQDNGEILGYKKTEYNLDNIYPGVLLFTLYHKTKKEKYKKAIFTLYDQLKNQPRNRSLGFWHKKAYPCQMWLNGLYMYGPFYAQYALEFGDKSDIDDILLQLNLMETHFRDVKSGLLYQAWDESRKQLWVTSTDGCSPTIFARAVGWYCMSLVDILEIVCDKIEYKALQDELLRAMKRVVPAILNSQDKECGLWFQVMDSPEHKGNYQETSASAMFIYFLYRVLKKSYCPSLEEEITQATKIGYKGICSKLSVDENGLFHLNGICDKSGLGRNPYRDGSFKHYVKDAPVVDDNKGLGAFLIASLEHENATQL